MHNIVMLYVYPESLPSQNARAIQVLYTCHALSRYVKKLYLAIADSPLESLQLFQNYGFVQPKNLEIIVFPRHFLAFNSSTIFNWYLKRSLPSLHVDVILARHLAIIPDLKPLHIPLIFESHQIMAEKSGVRNKTIRLERQTLLQSDGIAFLSTNLLNNVLLSFPLQCPTMVIPSGTTVDFFVSDKKLGQPTQDFVYAGTSRYTWKGLEVLFHTLELLEQGTLHLIGKLEPPWHEQNPLLQKLVQAGRLKLYGYLPHEQVRQTLQQFDIAVLPNSAGDTNSRLYTSPLKLLEYMAAKMAVVASDLASIREIVSEREVLFVKPDNPEALAKGIQTLFNNNDLRRNLAENAWQRVQYYSWEERAKKFLALVEMVLERRR
jgi:glycosyltransferase involved in cell wall biosynthesis